MLLSKDKIDQKTPIVQLIVNGYVHETEKKNINTHPYFIPVEITKEIFNFTCSLYTDDYLGRPMPKAICIKYRQSIDVYFPLENIGEMSYLAHFLLDHSIKIPVTHPEMKNGLNKLNAKFPSYKIDINGESYQCYAKKTLENLLTQNIHLKFYSRKQINIRNHRRSNRDYKHSSYYYINEKTNETARTPEEALIKFQQEKKKYYGASNHMLVWQNDAYRNQPQKTRKTPTQTSFQPRQS